LVAAKSTRCQFNWRHAQPRRSAKSTTPFLSDGLFRQEVPRAALEDHGKPVKLVEAVLARVPRALYLADEGVGDFKPEGKRGLADPALGAERLDPGNHVKVDVAFGLSAHAANKAQLPKNFTK
jgi:hypothetical protein